MLLFLLLLVLFWAVVPGLITGWMLHERGRSFRRGLLVGALCGPPGILGTLVFIYFSDRRAERRHRRGRGRAVRVFYDVPVVGRLHVSTVWALAGLATFLCAWMIGGIGYEFYRSDGVASDPRAAETVAGLQSSPKSRAAEGAAAAPSPSDTKETSPAQSNTSAQTRTSLLGNIAAQPGQPAPGGARADNLSTQPGPPATAGVGVAAAAPPPPSSSSAPPAPAGNVEAPTPAPAEKAPAQGRAEAVAEVTQSLAARGHRVHASLSGDAQTSTLSLTGATLTRDAGSQILGNARLRQALRAAGVRIVVMVNGRESWTYML